MPNSAFEINVIEIHWEKNARYLYNFMHVLIASVNSEGEISNLPMDFASSWTVRNLCVVSVPQRKHELHVFGYIAVKRKLLFLSLNNLLTK